MPRSEPEATATPSVLDRLIDLEPATPADTPVTRAQSVRAVKQSLKRDLEWLLNTRQIAELPPEHARELEWSLYTYGLPDFAALGVRSVRDQGRLLRMVEETIARFEPRLRDVRVQLVPVEAGSRELRFQIEALLCMDPAPERISFDTKLELTRGEYEVQGT